MNKVKFNLSVLFTKNQDLHLYIGDDIIILEYQKMFGKEDSDEEIIAAIGDIIEDQNNGGIIEMPEDFELDNDIRDR